MPRPRGESQEPQKSIESKFAEQALDELELVLDDVNKSGDFVDLNRPSGTRKFAKELMSEEGGELRFDDSESKNNFPISQAEALKAVLEKFKIYESHLGQEQQERAKKLVNQAELYLAPHTEKKAT